MKLRILLVLVVAGAAMAGAGSACSGGDDTSSTGFGGAGPSSGTQSGGGSQPSGTGGSTFTGSGGSFDGPWDDFPEDPIVEPSAPPNAPQLFEGATPEPNGGPCLSEPEVGALFPRNWLRPRFRFTPGPSQNLFEIRLHTPKQVNDLVVYTTETSWTMPKEMWNGLRAHVLDAPITMTVRGGIFDGTTLTALYTGSTGPFTIAPAEAAGAVVYWTTSGGSSLKGFTVGDETVGSTLQPPQVQMSTVGQAGVTCIGCHTSTPDGKFAGFTAQGPWGNALGSVEAGKTGDEPSFLGDGARAALEQLAPLGIQTYSKAHWKNGDHVMVTPFGDYAAAELAWVDLEAATHSEGVSYGIFERNGDPRGAGAPTWSHDGKTVVYVSTDVALTGRLDAGVGDLYSIPYANRQGGTATPIPGASDDAFAEYYPAFSPDDALLAFNRIPMGNNMYNAPAAELFVIPSDGGTATRLVANDPPACSGKTSPGVTNSWPKWAPESSTIGGKTYYWLIYSSTRGAGGNPQLYVTGVVVENGTITSYSSLYLWNQPEAENNHTPAWDVFKIPVNPPA
jgi:hypothetical protein